MTRSEKDALYPSALDPTGRFSSRVENYIRYRPGYPHAILELLGTECGFTGNSVVADIGSGTGILTRLFLDNGNRVFGVEPNPNMRMAGEQAAHDQPRFTSVDATAETTTLPDHSVDLIVVGQAFHWFDVARSRTEFARILVPSGWVALIWNERHTGTTSFLVGYEKLLFTYATDYKETRHERVGPALLREFFGADPRCVSFPNSQQFDFEGLKGRLLSSSYAPEAGRAGHEKMLAELRRLFDAYQQDGRVSFDYDTKTYFGKIS